MHVAHLFPHKSVALPNHPILQLLGCESDYQAAYLWTKTVFLKEAAQFWELFTDASKHGVARMDFLKKVVDKANI